MGSHGAHQGLVSLSLLQDPLGSLLSHSEGTLSMAPRTLPKHLQRLGAVRLLDQLRKWASLDRTCPKQVCAIGLCGLCVSGDGPMF